MAMLLGLIGTIISTNVFEKSKEALRSNGTSIDNVFSWINLHCIIGVLFVCLILIHIWQHRKFIKIFITKKLYAKNKISILMITAFILIFSSILLFLSGFTFTTLHIHGFIANIFIVIAIVHFITNFKKFRNFFRNR